MTRKIFYSAVLASAMVLSGLSAAHAGNLVFEASDEKAGKPARRSKAKRSPR